MKYFFAILILLTVLFEASAYVVSDLFQADLIEYEMDAEEEDSSEKEEKRETEDQKEEYTHVSWVSYVLLSSDTELVRTHMCESSQIYLGEIPTPPPELNRW